MSKESTKSALDRYYIKLAKPKRTTKNRNPEKEVERLCVAWMHAAGWSVEIYEAKATYNPTARRYISSSIKAGTVDCQGVMPDGTFVAIEFKAPKRLKSFNLIRNYRQKEYLVEKINSNAFGCVVDSAKRLEQIYLTWKELGKDEKRAYLLGALP